MEFVQPARLAEALEVVADRPDATPLAGGTDLLVDLNFDRRRPAVIVDLTRCAELAEWSRSNGRIRLGAGVTYTDLVSELAAELPGLAIASRTVGSPQIRNRGTVGGNLGTASPAGDAIPPLVAAGARVEVASASTRRTVLVEDFLTGPKQNALAPGELIVAIDTPIARGPQQFLKIGTRNAMVIAVATFSIALDTEARTVGTAIGSAAPTVVRARSAESFLADVLDESNLWEARTPLSQAAIDRFSALVAEAAAPIDDVRGTSSYRRHALGVMAGRGLRRVWDASARGS